MEPTDRVMSAYLRVYRLNENQIWVVRKEITKFISELRVPAPPDGEQGDVGGQVRSINSAAPPISEVAGDASAPGR